MGSRRHGLTVGTWNGLFLAQVARIVPGEHVGAATAASGFFVFVTYMVTPPAFGWLAGNLGYDTAFILVSFAPLVALVILADRQEAPAGS